MPQVLSEEEFRAEMESEGPGPALVVWNTTPDGERTFLRKTFAGEGPRARMNRP